MTQWAHADWVDPVGVIISFYDGTCPPPMAAAVVCTVGWGELATELVDWSPPTRIVYSAIAALPFPVTIDAGMSIGAQVITDWGQFPPYTGLTMSMPKPGKLDRRR